MDFWQTISILFRRWYVALPAFLLSILAALAVYASIPKVYVSTSVLVLTLPTTGSTLPADADKPRDQTNPLLNFDRGLSTSAAILIQALGTPEVAADLGVPPGSETYFTVSNGSTNPELMITGPFVFIQGHSATSDGAMDIVRKVSERADVELADRQRELKAPPSTFITAVKVVPPTTAEAQGGNRVRPAAAAMALGIIGSLAVTFGFESFMQARRRRQDRAVPAAPDEPVLETASRS
jgi:hypothetical protein